ncbi:two-component sensor histidine kinase [Thalassotalea insulae]|uniref:histidine kinase n=1 Tax=Thalassotalea insulae TaxID=2056778 RepID=A0ABQ6GXJ4_9GAMM|nr:ATP-binding protein [Thalassotalea insulae]GLX80029.1 two-component sensor histidine kinase [Thalassotalea insulae]
MHLIAGYFNSLKSRLLLSALLMVVVLLPIVGITILNAYQQHMNSSVENELVAYSYSILAVAEVEQGKLVMPEALAESRFNTGESGLYAVITSREALPRELWRSSSLLAMGEPDHLTAPEVGDKRFYSVNIEGNSHFIYSFSVSFFDVEQQLDMTLHIIKQKRDHIVLMNEFKRQLWFGLLLLMGILLLLQFIWLKWSLKPLAILKKEIANVEQGRTNKLNADYPQELQQVKEQLNVLLTTEQNQRKRYRNSLSDLAHSLKTPLAVLQGQVSNQENLELVKQGQEQIDVMNLMIEHQLKRAQSAGQSSWHLGVEIQPVLTKLVNSLEKIYRDKQLSYHSQINASAVFKGDEADLLEILGNLLDNASKAASETVSISINEHEQQLQIVIEDDGCGIADNEVEEILQRGIRADTYQQGHGIGLAIVRDLVDSYQGKLEISRSVKLQGAQFTLTFPH